MLPRAAQAALRRAPAQTPSHHLHHSILATASRTRTYASSKRPPPPVSPRPPPPASSRPSRPPPSRAPPASGPARQTSPGVSVPKDKTWKPQDGIKFAGAPAAAVPSAANAVNRAEDAVRNGTPIDGTRPGDTGAKKESIPEDDVQPQEPVAQQQNLDEPTPGSLRDQVQDAQAKAENTPPPVEETAGPESRQPLPDLRQGIPSTFDFEFGGKKAQEQSDVRSEQTDGVEIMAAPEGQGGSGGERGEREYHREDYETSLDRKRAQMANWLYIGLLTIITSGGFYLARPFNAREEVPSNLEPDDASGWSPGKMYARVRARLGSQMGYYTEPTFPKLLPEVPLEQRQPLTLVLSLEDLMVHSSWDRTNGYRVAKRPGIDYFIRYLSQYYELVLFTSVPLAMADPVIKKLDPYHFIMWPLGREATKYEAGEYVKDLSYLNRPLEKTLIIDTHAPHVKNQPENAIILPKWSGDPKDSHTKDLVALIPFLEYIATMSIDDVRTVLKSFEGKDIAAEFARREAEARQEFNKQFAAEQRKRPKFSIGSLAGSLGVSSGGMGGGMVLADGQSVSEGLRQGKMLSDQIREQGQKQYEHLEKQIRDHGAQWLKEEEEEQKRLMEASMRDMKQGAFSWFRRGASGSGGGGDSK